MGPFNFFPFSILGFTLLITFLLNYIICSTKSALNSSNSMLAKFYKFSSLVKGLIMVQQSLSLKKLLRSLRILFFCSTLSEKPRWFSRAFSKYSFEEIYSPSASTSCKVKSLTTHMKEGKYVPYSSVSISSLLPLDFMWIFLVRFITRDRFDRALSSILPTLLYRK